LPAGRWALGCLVALACCAAVHRQTPAPCWLLLPPTAERTEDRTFSVLLAPPPDPSLLAYAGPLAAAPNPRSAGTPHLPLDQSLLAPHAVTGTAGACMEKIDTPVPFTQVDADGTKAKCAHRWEGKMSALCVQEQ
jgi:hypothetical protein